MRNIIFFIIFLSAASPVFSNGIVPAPADNLNPPEGYASGTMGDSFYEKATIHILTVAPGASVPDVWGHTAIMVHDPRLERDLVFDYGMFYYGIDFAWNYVMGIPTYWLGVRTLEDTISFFRSERRPIYAQKLNLNAQQKKKFLDKLYYNARPDKRNYHYHHYYDNCTTRVRDLLDETVDNRLRRETETVQTGISFRKRSMEMVYDPVSWVGMNLMLNRSADKKMNGWELMFLPDEFMRGLEKSSLSRPVPRENSEPGEPVVGPVTELLHIDHPVAAGNNSKSFVYFTIIVIIYLLLFHVFPAFYEGKSARIFSLTGNAIWVVSAGSLGLFITVFWIISPREGFSWNWNLLSINPFLLLMPFMLHYAEKLKKITFYYLVFLTVLPAAGVAAYLSGILIQDVVFSGLYAVIVNGINLYRYRYLLYVN